MQEGGKRILIAGDSEIFLKSLARHLRREGFRVREAFSEYQARKQIEEAHLSGTPFDLVILDLGALNVEMVQLWVWAKKTHERLSFLVFSERGFCKTVSKIMRQGLDMFARKPILPDEILRLINQIDIHRLQRGDRAH